MTTEQKHLIYIPGLPEGYRLVCVDIKQNDRYRNDDGTSTIRGCEIVVEKIKPRRIVLEETNEERRICYGEWYESQEGKLMRWPYGGKTDGKHRVWREVKETDIPLTNEDANVKMGVSQGDGGYYPTLELNVKELRNVRSLIKDFENLGWFINPERALLLQKITEFINDK